MHSFWAGCAKRSELWVIPFRRFALPRNCCRTCMSKTTNDKIEKDLVLREIWRAKDALSAARGHSGEKLFADLREREKRSGHRVVNLQRQSDKPKHRKSSRG